MGGCNPPPPVAMPLSTVVSTNHNSILLIKLRTSLFQNISVKLKRVQQVP